MAAECKGKGVVRKKQSLVRISVNTRAWAKITGQTGLFQLSIIERGESSSWRAVPRVIITISNHKSSMLATERGASSLDRPLRRVCR